MTRQLVRVVLASLFIALFVFALRNRPSDAGNASASCPNMTDSITRLYRAYFNRDPDTPGFNFWATQYQTGSMSLEEISDIFSRSPEFPGTTLSNRAFVDWLYRSVVGPSVPATRAGSWVEALDKGYPRGTAVLTFTESQEFVSRTRTAKPLAGYLRWYPKGTHWYCSVGSTTVQVRPLTGEVWADYYVRNRGPSKDAVEIWTEDSPGQRHVKMLGETLRPGFLDYNWEGAFSGQGDYGRYLDVRAGSSTDWIVVFYPHSLGPDRLGWQLAR